MLTDIFARRYENVRIWEMFTEEPRRLIVQGFQLLNDLCPYYLGGKENDFGKAYWSAIHGLLARELGLKELSKSTWGYWTNNNTQWVSGTNTVHKLCETWMLEPFDGKQQADRFIKERLSLVELGFRRREEHIADLNKKLPESVAKAELMDRRSELRKGIVLPGKSADGVRAWNKQVNEGFLAAVTELNGRFRQAGCNLNYHNGFIQIAEDESVAREVETPFWQLVADPKWKNVDHDMKEAIDLRDTGGRDPALYAAKALESTIKIISDEKGWTTGNERGAAHFIDNLRGAKFIEVWEMEVLKAYFSKVRNQLGHGPGNQSMPNLTPQQTDWAIENCMIWAKSLIRRM